MTRSKLTHVEKDNVISVLDQELSELENLYADRGETIDKQDRLIELLSHNNSVITKLNTVVTALLGISIGFIIYILYITN